MIPRAHLFLREQFLFFNQQYVFTAGAEPLALDRQEQAVLSCLHRGESELGVLAHTLAELEIGGSAGAREQELLKAFASPTSLISIEPARPGLVVPDVIVCSFSPNLSHVDSRKLLRSLRRRHRVLHLGLPVHVRGPATSNVPLRLDGKRGSFRSLLHYVQWARSMIRFHTQATVILCGEQDTIFFGDLAASHRSHVILHDSWPNPTRLQDLLGAQALLKDPLPGLQALHYALRMTNSDDIQRLQGSQSSQLGWLELYALRHASRVHYGLADQALALIELGREANACLPTCVGPRSTRRKTSASGTLALVLDQEGFLEAAPMLHSLQQAASKAGFETCVLRFESGWFDMQMRGNHLHLPPRTTAPAPEAAVLFPGLLRNMKPCLELLAAGIPAVCYATQRTDHPLVNGLPAWVTNHTSEEAWVTCLGELRKVDSETRRAALDAARQLWKRFELAGNVEGLRRANRAEEHPSPPR